MRSGVHTELDKENDLLCRPIPSHLSLLDISIPSFYTSRPNERSMHSGSFHQSAHPSQKTCSQASLFHRTTAPGHPARYAHHCTYGQPYLILHIPRFDFIRSQRRKLRHFQDILIIFIVTPRSSLRTSSLAPVDVSSLVLLLLKHSNRRESRILSIQTIYPSYRISRWASRLSAVSTGIHTISATQSEREPIKPDKITTLHYTSDIAI